MTIVVIGHGRSPEGKNWGTRIDGCSTIVRMWDWEWQPPRDYGVRYDYGLFVLTPKGLDIFNKHNKRHPGWGWLAYVGKPTSGRLPDKTILVDTSRWCGIAKGMGGIGQSGKLTLTRGCAAACWAIEASPPGGTVILVGFDNVLLGTNQSVEKSFCPEYWNLYMSRFEPNVEKVYPVGQPKTATHDMEIERPLLLALAKERGVELQFAQVVWS